MFLISYVVIPLRTTSNHSSSSYWPRPSSAVRHHHHHHQLVAVALVGLAPSCCWVDRWPQGAWLISETTQPIHLGWAMNALCDTAHPQLIIRWVALSTALLVSMGSRDLTTSVIWHHSFCPWLWPAFSCCLVINRSIWQCFISSCCSRIVWKNRQMVQSMHWGKCFVKVTLHPQEGTQVVLVLANW